MAVQKQIHLEQDVRYEKQEFAFTKLMRCGKCGSGVTADDKYKKLKDGSTAKYILCEGNIFEKRELLTYLKDRILLANKIITLAK